MSKLLLFYPFAGLNQFFYCQEAGASVYFVAQEPSMLLGSRTSFSLGSEAKPHLRLVMPLPLPYGQYEGSGNRPLGETIVLYSYFFQWQKNFP